MYIVTSVTDHSNLGVDVEWGDCRSDMCKVCGKFLRPRPLLWETTPTSSQNFATHCTSLAQIMESMIIHQFSP